MKHFGLPPTLTLMPWYCGRNGNKKKWAGEIKKEIKQLCIKAQYEYQFKLLCKISKTTTSLDIKAFTYFPHLNAKALKIIKS